jgi:prophage regulatory protein
MQHEFVRWPAVRAATQLSRSTAWRLERDGRFPARRQLSANAVGWLRSEIDAWISSRGPASSRVQDSPIP